jgi:flavorubredoxin
MTVTNRDSRTNVHEIADGVYRISTPVPPEAIPIPGGFTFNQFLVVDDQPLLFHTGMRKLFPVVREAVAYVMPPEKLRWIAFSHFEADECGSLEAWLAAAPDAEPLCGRIGALLLEAERLPRALADGEELALGRHVVRWFDAPHVPHGWDCGFLGETRTRTLLCGDLFTQPGADLPPLTEADILGPSEGMRKAMDYYAHSRDTRAILGKLAAFEPQTLGCMHGSSWRGDGARLLGNLADALAPA